MGPLAAPIRATRAPDRANVDKQTLLSVLLDTARYNLAEKSTFLWTRVSTDPAEVSGEAGSRNRKREAANRREKTGFMVTAPPAGADTNSILSMSKLHRNDFKNWKI